MPASHPMHGPEATSRFFWTSAQIAAIAIGATFLVIGLLAFLPGIRNDYRLLDVTAGVNAIARARSLIGARVFLVGGGTMYLVLGVGGLLVHPEGWETPGAANSGLCGMHLCLAIGMIAAGIALSRKPRRVVRLTHHGELHDAATPPRTI